MVSALASPTTHLVASRVSFAKEVTPVTVSMSSASVICPFLYLVSEGEDGSVFVTGADPLFDRVVSRACSQRRRGSPPPALDHVVQTYVVPVAAAQDRNIPRTLDGEERMRSEYYKRKQLRKLRPLASPPILAEDGGKTPRLSKVGKTP